MCRCLISSYGTHFPSKCFFQNKSNIYPINLNFIPSISMGHAKVQKYTLAVTASYIVEIRFYENSFWILCNILAFSRNVSGTKKKKNILLKVSLIFWINNLHRNMNIKKVMKKIH